jgi:hypothetical protein
MLGRITQASSIYINIDPKKLLDLDGVIPLSLGTHYTRHTVKPDRIIVIVLVQALFFAVVFLFKIDLSWTQHKKLAIKYVGSIG